MAGISIYVIGDLHLSGSVDKSMEVFGGAWEGYIEKIEAKWRGKIKDSDIVVLPGDISWGMNFTEAREDFAFLHALPGKKYILKGNHDYWWTTRRKMDDFLESNGFFSIGFIHNGCEMEGKTALCGTRGWASETKVLGADDKKIIRREAGRLKESLLCAKKQNPERIYAFLHYPPIFGGTEIGEFTALLEEFGVLECFYGHLHGSACNFSFTGFKNGVKYTLVSADFVNFEPYLVQKL